MSNLDKIKKAIGKKNESIDGKVEEIIKSCIAEMYSWLDTNEKEWMNDTYNLLDSTGIGVYKDGVLIELVPLAAARASSPRIITYQGVKKSVNGRNLLIEAINKASDIDGHYTLAIFSTADYARAVEDGGSSGINRGKDWFKKLSEHIKNHVSKLIGV